MSSRPMPRLFLIRHGETAWSLSGQHTGVSDIPLTKHGEEQIRQKAPDLVGEGKIIDPKNIVVAYVSPRQRAHKTFHLLFDHLKKLPDHVLMEDVREWDYGEYDGLVTADILKKNPKWNIWKDGCPGGESSEDICQRVDNVITKVKAYHKVYRDGGDAARDVLIVAHGHFSKVFITRWNNMPLEMGDHFNVEPAGVAVLGYNHHNLEEPALNALNLHADLV